MLRPGLTWKPLSLSEGLRTGLLSEDIAEWNKNMKKNGEEKEKEKDILKEDREKASENKAQRALKALREEREKEKEKEREPWYGKATNQDQPLTNKRKLEDILWRSMQRRRGGLL